MESRIEHICLTPDEKTHALARLNRINRLILKWSEYFPQFKKRQIRNWIIKNNTTSLVVPAELRAEFASDAAVIASALEPDPTLGNRSLQDAVIQNYSPLAKKIASLWFRKLDRCDLSDWLQEAYMQIIESMYGWVDDGGADLTCYIHRSLENRLARYANQNCRITSRFSNQGLTLLTRFNKLCEQLPNTLSKEEVMEQMSLRPKDKQHLIDMTRATSLGLQKQNPNDGPADYAKNNSHPSLGSDRPTFFNTHEEMERQDEVQVLMTSSGLTDIEKELIDLSVTESKGWQVEYAKRICPRTRKPYGPMRISQMLKKARQKLMQNYIRINQDS